MKSKQNVYLCRHGETEWSLSGQHTGLTDIPLTKNGEMQARYLKNRLDHISFSKIFCSPLIRARKTAEICSLLSKAEIDPDLVEWNYGDYEGRKTDEIRKEIPDWNIFTHGAKNGESVSDITKRADRIISKILNIPGDVCLFSSGHISRAIISRWIELDLVHGKSFELSTASITILGFERENRSIKLLNETSHYREKK